MAALDINEYYGCKTCESASDNYGRGCKQGLIYPVMLIIANARKCPSYKFDKQKAEQQLND